jgi:asparagine synthase (glutamine-hydrolysing)
MNKWIAAINLDHHTWNEWLKQAEEWFKLVKLNKIREYRSATIYCALYDYDYFHAQQYQYHSLNSPFAFIDGYLIENTFRYSGYLPNPLFQDNMMKALNDSRGEFSFLSLNKDSIVLAADFYSSKPLYFYTKNKKLLFSNDLRMLLLNTLVEIKVDELKCASSLSSWFALGENEISSKETYLKDIYKLPPYHFLEAESGGFKIIPYLDLQKSIIDAKSIKCNDNYLETFRNLLDQSVYERVYDNQTSLMLSGGVDSSTILASIKSQKLDNQVTAYNLSFKDPALCNSHDMEIAIRLMKDLGIRGGVIWGDNLLRLSTPLINGDHFDFIDGPNPLANKIAVETITHYSTKLGATTLLTGEQGDVILGEDNILLIYDSLIKNGLYHDAFNTLNIYNSDRDLLTRYKNYFKYLVFNLIPLVRDCFYKSTYWDHTASFSTPFYFTPRMKELEKKLSKEHYYLSADYKLKLVAHKYILDYFFPRSSYFDALNVIVPNFHPFIDRSILEFVLHNPSHIHCDYKNYHPKENYRRAKFLARQAYEGILPDYARLKQIKTSYAGMARKIMYNSKEAIINLFFDRENIYIADLGLVELREFRKHLGGVLLKIDDPNNNLGVNFQFLRIAIQLEIWLNCINLSRDKLRELIKLKPPRALTEIEWINE